MPVEECVRQIIAAMTVRKRELVMRPRWKLMAIIKVLFPAVIDRIAANVMTKRDAPPRNG